VTRAELYEALSSLRLQQDEDIDLEALVASASAKVDASEEGAAKRQMAKFVEQLISAKNIQVRHQRAKRVATKMATPPTRGTLTTVPHAEDVEALESRKAYLRGRRKLKDGDDLTEKLVAARSKATDDELSDEIKDAYAVAVADLEELIEIERKIRTRTGVPHAERVEALQSRKAHLRGRHKLKDCDDLTEKLMAAKSMSTDDDLSNEIQAVYAGAVAELEELIEIDREIRALTSSERDVRSKTLTEFDVNKMREAELKLALKARHATITGGISALRSRLKSIIYASRNGQVRY
jgi:hypothetical protein